MRVNFFTCKWWARGGGVVGRPSSAALNGAGHYPSGREFKPLCDRIQVSFRNKPLFALLQVVSRCSPTASDGPAEKDVYRHESRQKLTPSDQGRRRVCFPYPFFDKFHSWKGVLNTIFPKMLPPVRPCALEPIAPVSVGFASTKMIGSQKGRIPCSPLFFGLRSVDLFLRKGAGRKMRYFLSKRFFAEFAKAACPAASP